MHMLFRSKAALLLTVLMLIGSLLTACGDSAPTAPPSPTTDLTAQALLGKAPTPSPVTKLPDSTLPTIKSGKAKLLGSVDGTTPITFTVALKLSQQQLADLQKLIQSSGDPGSIQNGQYIGNDEFLQKYAPTADQVRAVQAYMQANGVEVVSIAKNNMSAIFKAPASLLQDTFKVKINRYQETRTTKSNPTPAAGAVGTPDTSSQGSPNQPPTVGSGGSKFTPGAKPPANGTTETFEYYANDSDLSVPGNYLPYIQTITLNDYPINSGAKYSSMPLAGSNFQGYFPSNLKVAYNLAPMAQAGMDGSGQTIAIFASGGYVKGDIDTYAKQFGLPAPQIETILVDGADGSPTGDAIEVTLDIEVALAIAPKAKILLYEVPKANDGMMLDALTQIVTENRTKIINISYGLCEIAKNQSSFNAFYNVFAQARAEGMSVFVAAGDDGAYDCAQVDDSIASQLSVDYPASDPNVMAVGGTALIMKNGQYDQEIAWGEPNDPSGGGGGISAVWQLPTYQQNVVVQASNPSKARQVPDASANADSYTGYAIYCTTTKSKGCRGWTIIGGTSAAAPLFAASTAIVDQYLATKFKNTKALLIAPEYLYVLQSSFEQNNVSAAPFRDIVQNDNLYYSATKGFDLATGFGSPDFMNIATDLEQLFRKVGAS